MGEDTDFRDHTFGLPMEESGLAKSLVNESIYAGRRLSTDIRVPGRIGDPKYFDFWKNELKASDFILDTIQGGYKFPFASVLKHTNWIPDFNLLLETHISNTGRNLMQI